MNITFDQLVDLYFDIIITKFTKDATFDDVYVEFEVLNRYIDKHALKSAYVDAMSFLAHQ